MTKDSLKQFFGGVRPAFYRVQQTGEIVEEESFFIICGPQ